MREVNASPRAALLIESMRDIGYSLETALADIIDNSITAGAVSIDIFTKIDGS
ncbi:MAG: ATP-binding protein, partial [Chloroflexi bacterium]|nr:ATP-binding protein [Chloroflexota bacterium]